ncbi:hypothetical protein KIW84_023624 [Lathyrus oleraceus]|uniref:Integrase catalytic domain-containing protein n=1 Tax=Pisum sativum TaxID=3888 RepID=A0A9D4YDG2_PEA|nr:hypothetical protein KIW84_023624 [Pisum sativum]
MVRVREISESLISVRDFVPLRNLIEIMLNALSEEYDPIVTTVNNKEDLGYLNKLESCLLAHELRLQKHRKAVLTKPVSVNLTQASPPSSYVTTDQSTDGMESFPLGTIHVNPNIFEFQCSFVLFSWSFLQSFHDDFTSNVSTLFGYVAPRPTPPPSPLPQAFLTGSDPNFINQWWYPDSGVSYHVTPDSSNLSDFISFPGSEQVFMGNVQGLSINPIGSMQFPLPNYPNISLTLHNLLLVPHITKTLINFCKFAQDNHVFFEFHPQFCLVKSQASSEILLPGFVGTDGLYKLPNPFSQLSKSFPSLNTCVSSSSETSNLSNSCNHELHSNHVNTPASISHNKYGLWHTCLGHPHHHAHAEVLKLGHMLIPLKPPAELCVSCYLGKSHMNSTSLSTTVYNHPLELVICDLWGPSPIQSSGGYTYFLTCVDAYSRFVSVFPLRLKSNTLTQFIQFKTMVELQFNCKIKGVQSDGE